LHDLHSRFPALRHPEAFDWPNQLGRLRINSIRKLVPVGIASTAAAAVVAFALAPAAVFAEWSPRPAPKQSGTERFEVAAPAPSPQCLSAKQAIVSARAADRSEDMDETASNDVSEDQTERAAMKTLWTNLISACAPQVAAITKPTSAQLNSSACVTAKTNLKNAITAERAHEMSEASSGTEGTSADWQEDQTDFAALKALWKTAAAACGFTFEHR